MSSHSCISHRLANHALSLLVVFSALIHGAGFAAAGADFAGVTEESPPVSGTTPSDSEGIARWIVELDDNQFVIRERAQEKLQAAGIAAIEAVGTAARDGSLERKTRALNILLAWSEGNHQPQLRIKALEKIVKLRDRPYESKVAWELLADVKQTIALAKIEELGGSYFLDVRSRIGGTRLQVIIDKHWKGGIEGLAPLKDVHLLATLSFHSAPLGSEVTDIIQQLPRLKVVEIYGMGFTEAGIAEIRRKFPRVTFDIRQSALLGVRGDVNQQRAVVARVEPGTAAEKAGVKKDDLIVEMEGVKIQDFTHLTREIAKCEAGQSVSLTVARRVGRGPGMEELDLTVTFDCWGEKKRDENMRLQLEQVLKPKSLNLDRR